MHSHTHMTLIVWHSVLVLCVHRNVRSYTKK